MRILLIDDSKAMRRVQKDVLAELKSIEILEAEDGISAIHALRELEFQVDLILVDWMMPGIDGLTFVNLMKSHPNVKSIPILMVTSCSEEAQMRQAWNSGVDGYLLKPFTKELFLKAVVSLAGGRSAELPAGEADAEGDDTCFLAQLPEELRNRLINMSVFQEVPSGQTIVGPGEVPEYFYFLHDGNVVEDAPAQTREGCVLRTYNEGECFAVTELMAHDPLRTRFTTTAATRLGVLPREVFEGMLEKFPKMSLALSRYLAAKARGPRVEEKSDGCDLLGRFGVLDLPTLIQAISLRQRTCTIELPDQGGVICFVNGQVTSVETPHRHGEEAFFELMSANPVQFKVIDVPPRLSSNVQTSTTKLLLESAKLLDHARRQAAATGA
jgi:two-component system chemotaxis response regulator CheY